MTFLESTRVFAAVTLTSTMLLTVAAAQESLFDGKSLDGWDYDAKHWRVDSGAIVGEIPKGQTLAKNTWIVWRGGEVADFDLRLKVKLTGAAAANSGIQFRCQVDGVDHVSGYQADLDQGATWLGRIYDEHGRRLLVERGRRVHIAADGSRSEQILAPAAMYGVLFRENDWNDYRIVAIGERVSVFVNGTLFSDFTDQQIGQRDLSGSLAFQLHSGPETRVEFRDITLESLRSIDQRLGRFEIRRAQPAELSGGGITPLSHDGESLNLDFETGDLSGWTLTGDAFQGQPIRNDGISRRWPQQKSNKQGAFFVAGYERVGDAGQGELTSQPFVVTHPYASYLLAGGRKRETRVELLLPATDEQQEVVISEQAGNQREQMQRVLVDLRDFKGKTIAIRLVDESTGGWGHLNFDDFRFHTASELKEHGWAFQPQQGNNEPVTDAAAENLRHSARTSFIAEQDAPARTRGNPLLQHLVPNPVADAATQTVRQMHVPEGFSVDLVAAEPQLHQPMAFTFDAKGRLWVVEGHSYPNKRPKGKGLDRVLIFSDEDANGSFETRKVFTEGLNLVSGMQVGWGGVWIGAAPKLLFIPDRDGDDRPDGPPQVLLDGFGYADTHETLNSFIWGPDGWLYGNQGVFNQSHIGKPGAAQADRVALAAGVWRYHPTKHLFEVFAHGGSNQWGLDFDDHGQLFMTHCRSHWGKGPTTHVIQGAHYWNQVNSGYAPFISPKPIAGLPEMRNFMLASARYGHGEGGAGKRGSRAVYGGHSHVGTMIYLGDNWPIQYRNHLFTNNLHGHQINQQVNLREGSGYNTVHAGADVLLCEDPQYVAVDLQCGPDGAVYISDWYDPRHCHNPNNEQWDRGNGRMYRMKFDANYRPVKVDYTAASDEELVAAQLHSNEWHVRMARLVLSERATVGSVSNAAIAQLRKLATGHKEAPRRLRAMWCLHAIGALDRQLVHQLLADESPYVRAWTIQLATESADAVASQGSRSTKSQAKTADGSYGHEALLAELAAKDSSLLVRQYLASAAGRVDSQLAWTILETLASQPENAADRNLPLLIWYHLADRIRDDLPRGLDLADKTKIPALRDSILWYAPQLSPEGRDAIARRLAAADGSQRSRLLSLFSAALQGMRGLEQPAAWAALAPSLYDADAPGTRRASEDLGAAFGDDALFDRMRKRLADAAATPEAKRHALAIISHDASPVNVPLLLASLDTPKLTVAAIRQLKSHRDPSIAEALLARLPGWQGTDSDVAMETLCSRAAWAKKLLDAVADGHVDPSKLTAFYARQMSNLGDDELNQRLMKQWGRLGQSSAETKAAIKHLVAKFSAAPLWAFSRSAGEGHFKKLCANCHMDSEQSQRIGPKLDGTGSKGIEYIVENILDPNAVIGKDFQARQILTVDGLVVTGVIIRETDSAVTVRTANSTQTIARDEIEELAVSKNSFMPQGLLDTLNEQQRIELLKYLMSR